MRGTTSEPEFRAGDILFPIRKENSSILNLAVTLTSLCCFFPLIRFLTNLLLLLHNPRLRLLHFPHSLLPNKLLLPKSLFPSRPRLHQHPPSASKLIQSRNNPGTFPSYLLTPFQLHLFRSPTPQ